MTMTDERFRKNIQHCCNYVGGERGSCILTGKKCFQMEHQYVFLCTYYINAVLPHDKELYHMYQMLNK